MAMLPGDFFGNIPAVGEPRRATPLVLIANIIFLRSAPSSVVTILCTFATYRTAFWSRSRDFADTHTHTVPELASCDFNENTGDKC